MTKFTANSDINSTGLVNELGNRSPLWSSILKNDNKFINANGGTLVNFNSLHRGSRSNIETIGADLFLDANLDPYTITVELRDDEDRIFATGQKSTVVKQQFLDAIENIEIEYNKIISNLINYTNRISDITSKLAVISFKPFNINGFLNFFVSNATFINSDSRNQNIYNFDTFNFPPDEPNSKLHLLFIPFAIQRFGPSDDFSSISDISNIFASPVHDVLITNQGVQNNKAKLRFLDQDVIDELLDSVDSLAKKDDTLEEFQGAIDEFFDDTDPPPDEISLKETTVPLEQIFISDSLTPTFESSAGILSLTGFPKGFRRIDKIIASVQAGFQVIREQVYNYENIFDIALEGIADMFYVGGQIVYSGDTSDSDGSCLDQAAFDNFNEIDALLKEILSAEVYTAVSNQCSPAFFESSDFESSNPYLDDLNAFILIKNNAEIEISAMITELLLLSERLIPNTTDLDEQIAILDQLVIDATKINIPLTYERDDAGIFDLDSFTLSLSFAEVTDEVKIIEFNVTSVPVIEESFRDAGNCSVCNVPLIECDGNLYSHRLAESGVDPTSEHDSLELNSNKFIYYGERLLRTQDNNNDVSFASADTVLDDYLTEVDNFLNLENNNISQDPLRKLGNSNFFSQLLKPVDAGSFVAHNHTDKVLRSEINPRDPFRRRNGTPTEIFNSKIEDILPQFAKENPYTDFLHPTSDAGTFGVTDIISERSIDISDVRIIPCSEKPQVVILGTDDFGNVILPPTDFDYPKGKVVCGDLGSLNRLCGEAVTDISVSGSLCGILPAVLFSGPEYGSPRFHNHIIHTELTARTKLWLSGKRTADNETGYATNEGAGVFFENHLAVLIFSNQPLSSAQFGTVSGGSFSPLNTTIVSTSGDSKLIFADGDSISLNVIKNDTYEITVIGVDGTTIKTIKDHTLKVTENGFDTAILTLEGGCTHANVQASITVEGFSFSNKPLKAGVFGLGGFEAQHFCVTFINERIHGPYVFL